MINTGLNIDNGGRAGRVVVGIMSVVLLSLTGSAGALSNDGGGSWIYYKDLTITNTGGALSDYQVLVNLTGSHFPVNAKADGADVRFTDAGGVELSYWIESWGAGNAKIWVKVPSIPVGATTIRMYYGNPSASSSSKGDNTFIFFDDFPSTSINAGKWDVAAKTCSEPYNNGMDIEEIDTNGNLHIYDSGSYWCGLRSLNLAFPENWAYSVKLKVDADANFQAFGVDWTTASFFPYDTTGYPLDRTSSYNTNFEIKSANVDATSWGEYIIIRNNTGLYFYDKGSLENVHTNQIPSPGGNRALHFTVAGGRHMYVEWVKVRKYASPEPSVTGGAESGIQIPEFPTLALPIISVLGLLLVLRKWK